MARSHPPTWFQLGIVGDANSLCGAASCVRQDSAHSDPWHCARGVRAPLATPAVEPTESACGQAGGIGGSRDGIFHPAALQLDRGGRFTMPIHRVA